MFIKLRQCLRIVLPALLVVLTTVHRIEAFQIGSKLAQKDGPTFGLTSNQQCNLIKSSEQKNPLLTPFFFSTSSSSSTEISAKKKKKAEEEPEREKKNGFELVLLYMTPWRNPNAIFVYLFAGVYCLGKYSEAQSIAAASGAL